MTTRVGIDFRVFQVGHQFRGIGEVARRTLEWLDAHLEVDDSMVLYVDPDGPDVSRLASSLIDSDRTTTTVVYPNPRFPRLAKAIAPLTAEREQLLADTCDVFVEFDFMLGVPESVPAIVVLYDQIPLLLGDQFPENYRPTYAAARRAGLPVKQAVYKAATRTIYERMLAAALRRADGVLVISDHTAATTRSFAEEHGLGTSMPEIRVAHLGHGAGLEEGDDEADLMTRYRVTGLGLDTTPFVFFMGGTDERRRIDDLVAAFNSLRAAGRRLKLVLGGYDFVSVDRVLSPTTRHALQSSSYRDDIHLLGFVDHHLRAWLYTHAEAFVFPSIYEGFGLPVVESLSLGCPVVAYDNSSLREVAGPNCLLVENRWELLGEGIATLMDRPADTKRADESAGRQWADRFTWDDFGSAMAEMIGAASASR